jgi:hypothetical protein
VVVATAPACLGREDLVRRAALGAEVGMVALQVRL